MLHPLYTLGYIYAVYISACVSAIRQPISIVWITQSFMRLNCNASAMDI